MAKPVGFAEGLAVQQSHQKGKYELIVFNVPWLDTDVKLLPLIIDAKAEKIVGIMLPFNELSPVLTKKESEQIQSLGMQWTVFIMKHRFGLEP